MSERTWSVIWRKHQRNRFICWEIIIRNTTEEHARHFVSVCWQDRQAQAVPSKSVKALLKLLNG